MGATGKGYECRRNRLRQWEDDESCARCIAFPVLMGHSSREAQETDICIWESEKM